MSFRVFGILALAAFGLATPLRAADIAKITSNDGKIRITLTGRILEGDADKLRDIMRPAKDKGTPATIVELNSPGGRIAEGVQIARIVRQAKMTTAVPERAQCASACFIIFAGGTTRSAHPSAYIGVHGASDKGRETPGSEMATVSMARILKEFGVPPAIIGQMVVTPPDRMVRLTNKELSEMAVAIAPAPSSSSYNASQSLITLYGSPQGPAASTSPSQTPSPAPALPPATGEFAKDIEAKVAAARNDPSAAMQAWDYCLTHIALTVSRGSYSTPEAIAETSFASCKSEEARIYQETLDTPPPNSDAAAARRWKAEVEKQLWPAVKLVWTDKMVAAMRTDRKKVATITGKSGNNFTYAPVQTTTAQPPVTPPKSTPYTEAKDALARRDYAAATRLAKPLAEQGDFNAQTILAMSYEYGFPADDAEALVWYRRAADAGQSTALRMLGRFYANGKGGLSRDPVMAHMMLTLAVANGNRNASNDLSKIEEKMTPDEIAQGKNRASEWRRTSKADQQKLETEIP